MSAGTAILIIFIALMYAHGWKRDSTDNPVGSRSGMSLYTDNATGVQYLGGMFGPTTPRLKADGSLYTIKDEQKP